jgi:hypothetical protein
MTFGTWDGSNNRIEATNRPLFLTSYTTGVSLGYSGSKALTVDSNNNVGIGITTPAARTHFFGSRIESDQNYLYSRSFTFDGASAFSNPTIPIITINSGGGYSMFTILVKVFQTSWAGNTTIVSQGVAMISTNNSGTSVYTPYAGTMSVIGGNSTNVGTLSWSSTTSLPSTLNFNGVRVSNYDQYVIVAEMGQSGGYGNYTWGTFTGS